MDMIKLHVCLGTQCEYSHSWWICPVLSSWQRGGEPKIVKSISVLWKTLV